MDEEKKKNTIYYCECGFFGYLPQKLQKCPWCNKIRKIEPKSNFKQG